MTSTPVSPQAALIVGASGFLGSHLARTCAAAGLHLYGVDRRPPMDASLWSGFTLDAAESADYKGLLGSTRLDTCFFLGGSAEVAVSLQDPYRDFKALLPGLAYTLEYLRSAQREAHLVYFSSAAVYGQARQLPVTEEHPIAPITPYGAHKHSGEQLIRDYSRIYGLSGSVLRIFSAYGIYNRRMLFWDLMKKWCSARDAGHATITAQGTGNETRDFIHATDVARAALLVAGHPVPNETRTLNVGSGREVRIRDAAELLLGQLPHPVSMTFTGQSRPSDPTNWVADVSRLDALGFRAMTELRDGLGEYGSWFANAHATSH